MNRIQYFIIFLFMLIGISCDKKVTGETSDIYGKWEVTDFMSVESVAYPKNKDISPLIDFREDGTFILKTDVNLCLGSFSVSDDYSISVSLAGCTKVCCDSEFSKKLITMLPQVKSFHFEQKKLKLEVPEWGWIELVLYN